jgi:hypothetical protein
MLKPKKKKTTTHDIGLIQLVAGKYKKIELIMNTKKNEAGLTSMKIKHALLHPRVNGPTRTSSTYNEWKP